MKLFAKIKCIFGMCLALALSWQFLSSTSHVWALIASKKHLTTSQLIMRQLQSRKRKKLNMKRLKLLSRQMLKRQAQNSLMKIEHGIRSHYHQSRLKTRSMSFASIQWVKIEYSQNRKRSLSLRPFTNSAATGKTSRRLNLQLIGMPWFKKRRTTKKLLRRNTWLRKKRKKTRLSKRKLIQRRMRMMQSMSLREKSWLLNKSSCSWLKLRCSIISIC